MIRKYQAVFRLTVEKPFLDYIETNNSQIFPATFQEIIIPGSVYMQGDGKSVQSVFGDKFTKKISSTEYETEEIEYQDWLSDILSLSVYISHYALQDGRDGRYVFRIDGTIRDEDKDWSWRAYFCNGNMLLYDEDDKVDGEFPVFDRETFVSASI